MRRLPFDGTVKVVARAVPGQRSTSNRTQERPDVPLPRHTSLKVGDRVKAGDPVATVPPADFTALGPGLPPTVAFDTGLESVVNGGPAYESFFLHMTGAVLAQFAVRGFTPERLIVPKAERDAAPALNNRSNVDYAGVVRAFTSTGRHLFPSAHDFVLCAH
jgi:hypothetical protein